MLTTGIIEFCLGLYEYYYVKKKMKLNIELFTKDNFIYLFLGLCFIPISLIIRKFNFGLIINIISIMLCCSLFYFMVLYIKKDKNLFMIINRFFW